MLVVTVRFQVLTSPRAGRQFFSSPFAHYTIIEIEKCKSNPKFETVALLAKELNISLDATIFPDMVTGTVSKTVVDFFAGKSEAEIQKYIALCKQAETFQKDE